MTDIHALKNLSSFLPYLREETWYILLVSIALYLLYLLYIKAFERYSQSPTTSISEREQKSSRDILNDLDVHDAIFFERMSLLIRSCLEDSEKVALATKKTPEDIQKESISREIKEILHICTHYEYTGTEATLEQKREVFERLQKVLPYL